MLIFTGKSSHRNGHPFSLTLGQSEHLWPPSPAADVNHPQCPWPPSAAGLPAGTRRASQGECHEADRIGAAVPEQSPPLRRGLPFLSTARLAGVIPTRFASSPTDIFRLASITSKSMSMTVGFRSPGFAWRTSRAMRPCPAPRRLARSVDVAPPQPGYPAPEGSWGAGLGISRLSNRVGWGSHGQRGGRWLSHGKRGARWGFPRSVDTGVPPKRWTRGRVPRSVDTGGGSPKRGHRLLCGDWHLIGLLSVVHWADLAQGGMSPSGVVADEPWQEGWWVGDPWQAGGWGREGWLWGW